MKANGFVKIFGTFLVIVLLFAMLRSKSLPEDQQKGTPPLPSVTNVTSSDNDTATVTTLLSRDAEREQNVSNLSKEIAALKQLMIEKDSAAKEPTSAENEEISALRKQLAENKDIAVRQQSEIEKLAAKLNQAGELVANTTEDMKDRNFFKPKNPLKNSEGYEIQSDSEPVWTYPIDQPTVVEDGVFTAKNWLKDAKDGIKDSTLVKDIKEENVPKPVYTIPENTHLVGTKLASRIIAKIPKSGTVNNPMGFTAVVPEKILAANGFVIDGLKEALVGGYAVGDFSLRCARGYVTSFTFIFEDGRIAQVGSNMANTGQEAVGSNTLAVLTDTAGTECVAGTLHTNAPEFITTNVLLGAAGAGAAAMAGAQTTTQQGNDSANTSVTGDTGKYIAGQAGVSGVNQAAGYINEIWKDTTDVVVVDISEKVNITVKQPIAIDYNPLGRKVVHDWSLTDENHSMEAFWK